MSQRREHDAVSQEGREPRSTHAGMTVLMALTLALSGCTTGQVKAPEQPGPDASGNPGHGDALSMLEITSPASGSVHEQREVLFAGTCERGGLIAIQGDVAAPSSTACDASGMFMVEVQLSAGGGKKTVTFRQMGAAGRVGSTSLVVVLAGPVADAAVTTDAGGSSAPPPEGKVPVFVAVGHCRRRAMSCDGGRTWPEALDFEESCADRYADHSADSATAAHSLDYGAGWWIASYGWGASGPVLRSQNGVDWESTSASGRGWGGGVAYANGRFFLARPPGQGLYSSDLGTTWNAVRAQAGFEAPERTRGVAVLRDGSAEVVFMGEQQSGDYWLTSLGQNDFTPADVADDCAIYGAVSNGQGIAVSMSVDTGDGHICRSTDNGRTWTRVHSFGFAVAGQPNAVYFKDRFAIWYGGKVWSSPDGAPGSWGSTNLEGGFTGAGLVAYSPALNRLVAINGWHSPNQGDKAYWSTNGVKWTQAESYRAGGGITYIGTGWVEPSAACPLPND